MSSLIRTALLLLLIMATGMSSYAQGSTDKVSPPDTKILLFGDSIIAGYGLAESESIAVQLEKYMSDHRQTVKIINAGVSGDTTNAGLSRLAWTLKRNKPDIVFLALGGNDVLRGLNPDMTRNNLEEMLKILKDNKIQVILSKVQAPSSLGADYMQQLNDAYESLAQKYAVPLYPFLLTEIFTTPKFMQEDGIHPSAEGVKVITKPLGDFLIKTIIQNSPKS